MRRKGAFRYPLWCLIFFASFSSLIRGEDPVIYFTYLFNWNANHAGAPISGIPALVEQGHKPLLDLFEKHDQWTTQFYFSAYTSDYLRENNSDVIKRVKKGIKKGRYEMGTYTVSHPILNLTPYNSLMTQLEASVKHDKKVWGVMPTSIFLPENSWDVTLPQVLQESGLAWISIYKDIIPAYADEKFYPPAMIVKGINETSIPAVFCGHYLTQGSVEDLKHYLDELYEILKEQGIKEHFVAFKGDAEDIYFGSLSTLNARSDQTYEAGQILPELPAIKEWDERLEMVENLPYAKFMTMGEWLKKHPAKETIPNENISMSADFSRWIRGNGVERINILTDEARWEVSNAKYAIELAEKMGLNVSKAKKLLDEAKYQLMLSEGADGRATNPPASRKVFVMEAAVNATKLAWEAVQAIENK